MLSRGFDEPSLLRRNSFRDNGNETGVPYVDDRGHYDAIVPIEVERKSYIDWARNGTQEILFSSFSFFSAKLMVHL